VAQDEIDNWYLEFYCDDIRYGVSLIDVLVSQMSWIPVKEGLPKDNNTKCEFIVTDGQNVYTEKYYPHNGNDPFNSYGTVTHWQPKPAPPCSSKALNSELANACPKCGGTQIMPTGDGNMICLCGHVWAVES